MQNNLVFLINKLNNTLGWADKKKLLSQESPAIAGFLEKRPHLKKYLDNCSDDKAFVLEVLIFLGQGERLFGADEDIPRHHDDLERLSRVLLDVERFYISIGGLLGYHYEIYKRLKDSEGKVEGVYSIPPMVDFVTNNELYRQAMRWGIIYIPEVAEIYVAGGAGDRLDLRDDKTHEPLPAAKLPFSGHLLIEGLIRDLEAREYLSKKMTGKKIITPVVIMTSEEKNNHQHIVSICEELKWFGRPRESFFFIKQPLVPVLTEEGVWSCDAPFKLQLKPGGHGVLWKLAMDSGAFDWLQEQGRNYVIVRQVNNPLAGLDGGLLALSGWGKQYEKAFGFVSCEREPGSAEGILVLETDNSASGTKYKICNVEYHLKQADQVEGPANTNIIFANINSIKQALRTMPLPGLILNMKSKVKSVSGETEVRAGRLETMMQNITEAMEGDNPRNLPVFVGFFDRKNIFSVAKNSFSENKKNETPEKAYYDLLKSYYTLLKNYSRVDVPPLGTFDEFLENKWGFIAYFNPALGPLFAAVGQKIKGGKIHYGSELELDIAELDLQNVSLQGSFRILGKNLNCRCALKNIQIVNSGIDTKGECVPWRRKYQRRESLEIILGDNSEFYAHDITFEGPFNYVVPDNHRMNVFQEGLEKKVVLQPLSYTTWWWNYLWDEDNMLHLRKMAQV